MRKTESRSLNKGFPMAVAIGLLWCGLLAATWSRSPFWPDADGYALHVEQGEWVAHPPGYLLFMLLGRGFHALGLSPYPAVQAASLLLAAISFPLLYQIFRRSCESADAAFLLVAYAFSWLVLILSQTGTSHAGDLATMSFLLWIVTSEKFRNGNPTSYLLFALGVIACATMRLNSAIMEFPFFVAVLIRHGRRPGIWLAYMGAAIAILAIQAGVIQLSGGWDAYTTAARNGHLGNRRSSLLLSGVSAATLLNAARTIGWWILSGMTLLLIPFFIRWKQAGTLPPERRELLVYGIASIAGCLGVCSLYLCTHPGFLCPALPGTFICAAALLPMVTPGARTGLIASALALSLALFMLVRPFRNPQTPLQAAANGILLQYGACSVKNSIFKTTAGWLKDSGFEKYAPPERVRELEEEAERKKAAAAALKSR